MADQSQLSLELALAFTVLILVIVDYSGSANTVYWLIRFNPCYSGRWGGWCSVVNEQCDTTNL